MVAEHQVSGSLCLGNCAHLGAEPSFLFRSRWIARWRQPTRVGVVAQEHDHAFSAAGYQLSRERAKHRLSCRIRIAGIADQIEGGCNLIPGPRGDGLGGCGRAGAAGKTHDDAQPDTGSDHQAAGPA
jgi:hypothetical protein